MLTSLDKKKHSAHTPKSVVKYRRKSPVTGKNCTELHGDLMGDSFNNCSSFNEYKLHEENRNVDG